MVTPLSIGVTTFGTDGARSGISCYLRCLIDAMREERNDLDLELLAFDDERRLHEECHPGVRTVGLSASWRAPLANIAWHQLGLPRLCRRRGYDVLFLPAANRRLPAYAPCRTVGTVHDLAALRLRHKYDRLHGLYGKQLLPALIRRLDHVLTVSEASKADIVTYAEVPPSKITVTPLAADHRRFYPARGDHAADRMAEAYGLPHPYILYVSRLEHPGKNHVRLIRAFERLKGLTGAPHHLVIAGSDWWRAEVIHEAARTSAVADAIHLLGFVASGHLADLYRGASLFVFPSLYEGFGLPLLEAMACGTPVACANVSSLPEVAGEAATLFDPYDEDEMAEAMGTLLFDDAARDKAIARGIARSAEFSWAETARRTLAVLQGTT